MPDANQNFLFSSFIAGLADSFEFPVSGEMLENNLPVNHAERAEGHGFTPAADFFSSGGGFAKDFVVLLVPVMLAVDGNARGIKVATLEDAVDEKLQLAQRLAMATDESAGIGRRDVQKRHAANQRLFDSAGNVEVHENCFDNFFGIQLNGRLIHNGGHFDLPVVSTGAVRLSFRRLSHCCRMDRNCCSVQYKVSPAAML